MKLLLPVLLICAVALAFLFLRESDDESGTYKRQGAPEETAPYETTAQGSVDRPKPGDIPDREAASELLADPLMSLSPRSADLVERDIPQDVSRLRTLAENGDLEAAYDLYRIQASCTRNSTPEECTSDEVDVDEGARMLALAAESGYWPAQVEYLRALYIFDGTPSRAEQEKGVAFLKAAADAGAADAMFRLADYSINGLDFTTTYEEGPEVVGDLSRVDAYANLLAAGAVYKQLKIRARIVDYVQEAGVQLSPFEVMEARRRAEVLLNKPACCKVWKH